MTNEKQMQAATSEQENMCLVRLPVQLPQSVAGGVQTRRVENVRNCDVFVEDFHVLIYADVRLLKFFSPRQLDTKDMKNLIIHYNSQDQCYELQLPCMPQTEEHADGNLRVQQVEKGVLEEQAANKRLSGMFNLWKLKRITDHCQLQLDNNTELLHCEANFGYGFASNFRGHVRSEDCFLSSICRMPEPHRNSPLQRAIDREIDEFKDFSRDQYKLNFVELQVPEGHDNPMKYTSKFDDIKLNKEQECLLHNLTHPAGETPPPDSYDKAEVDCGLISLLLGICYDVRSTFNEPTCESGWTRSILSAMLCYFEPCDNVKEVVISFLRRSLIYPLYRNYDFSRLCVQDAIEALQKERKWIVKQLLLTHELFLSDRDVFNYYYINDYIRYVSNETLCTSAHLQMLAHNLKNVLLDVYKKHLRLELAEIETELLKELITDIHIGANLSHSEDESDVDDVEEDGDDGDEGTESGEDISESTATSESEENSVIEQCLDTLKAA